MASTPQMHAVDPGGKDTAPEHVSGSASDRSGDNNVLEVSNPENRDSITHQAEDVGDPKKSVKYLTCWYWLYRGHCNKTEEQCMYSHHDTGKHADQPRPARNGGRMVAGRNARHQVPARFYSQGHYRAPVQGTAASNQVASSGYNSPLQFVPPSVERLNISGNSSTPLGAGTQVPPQPAMNYMAPLPPAVSSIPSTGSYERRLTVGAGRPSGSPQTGPPHPSAYPTYITPAVAARTNAFKSGGFSPPKASPLAESSTPPVNTTGSPVFANVQTARCARRLDKVLCDTLRSLIKLSEHVHKSPAATSDHAREISVLSGRIDELFQVLTVGRDEAKALAPDSNPFGEIFEQNPLA